MIDKASSGPQLGSIITCLYPRRSRNPRLKSGAVTLSAQSGPAGPRRRVREDLGWAGVAGISTWGVGNGDWSPELSLGSVPSAFGPAGPLRALRGPARWIENVQNEPRRPNVHAEP